MKLWLMLDNYNGKKVYWNYQPYKWHTKIFRFSLDLLTVYINGIWDNAVKPWPNIHLACENQIGLFFHAMGTGWLGARGGVGVIGRGGRPPFWWGAAASAEAQPRTNMVRQQLWLEEEALGRALEGSQWEDWRPSGKSSVGRTMITHSSHRSESAVDRS